MFGLDLFRSLIEGAEFVALENNLDILFALTKQVGDLKEWIGAKEDWTWAAWTSVYVLSC